MAVNRAIMLTDDSNGSLTVTTRPMGGAQFESESVVWATIADVRKFAHELLAAYPDPDEIPEGEPGGPRGPGY